MSAHSALRIGTRGSPLALIQTGQVTARLTELHPRLGEPRAVETIVVSTTGDRVRHELLSNLGGKGLFTKELDEAMLDGRIDIAIHSMKDMPTLLPEGIVAHAVMPREDPRDAFISNRSKDIAGLPAGARVGTASLRRSAQVRQARPDLNVVPLRGNVDTRLKKLDAGEVDATFLAVAGLRRLGKEAVITQAVPVHDMLPAVGQGTLCATCRTGDAQANTLLETLAEAEVTACVMAERAMLAALNGSCRTPIAGHAAIDPSGELTLKGMIAHPDGSEMVADEASGPAVEAERIGVGLARTLFANASPALVKVITESQERVTAVHPDMERERS